MTKTPADTVFSVKVFLYLLILVSRFSKYDHDKNRSPYALGGLL